MNDKNIKLKIMITNDELKKFVKRHDRKVGIYKQTIPVKGKRSLRLDNVPEKVLFIADWLIENNIDFQVLEAITREKKKSIPMLTDIYIPKYNIAMRYVDTDSKESVVFSNIYFKLMRGKSFPFFIRSNETNEFLIEKLKNCMNDFGKVNKTGLGKKYTLVIQKRKRIGDK